MILIYFAVLIAACSAAKLDRTYLPPPSAASAGGSPGSLRAPLARTSERAQNLPPGGFANDKDGIVVDAAIAGTRDSSQKTGLGGSRVTYGSTDSKVGDAAFRAQKNPNQNSNAPNSEAEDVNNVDLSAFYQPSPAFRPGNVQIIRDYVSNTIKYHNDLDSDKFSYGFETNNGIRASGNGVSINGVQAEGGYSYTGDDGKVYSISYTADEGGFRAHGSHLPTPPPIPAEILKALEQNARDEAAGVFDDGSYDAQKYNTDYDYAYSDPNDKYNDRQSNKFSNQPGSNGGAINQPTNQQGFVSSNLNGQLGLSNQNSKDETMTPDITKFSGAGGTLSVNNKNAEAAKEPSAQLSNNRFGFNNEYLPPKIGQFGNTLPTGGNKNSFSISPEQQNFQNSFDKLQSANEKLSSTDNAQNSFISQTNSPSNSLHAQASVSTFGIGSNNKPSIPNQSLNKLSQDNSGSDNTLNRRPSIIQQPPFDSDIKPTSFGQSISSVPSFPSQSTVSSEQFPPTNIPLQTTQNFNNRFGTTQFNSVPSNKFNPRPSNIAQTQFTNKPSSNFVTSFSSGPTKQPDITLTTPLETSKTNEPSTTIDSGKNDESKFTLTPDSTITNSQFQSTSNTDSSFSGLSTSFFNTNPQNSAQNTATTNADNTETTQNQQTVSTDSSIINGNTFSGFSTSSLNTNPKTTSQNFHNKQTTQLLQDNKSQVTQTVFPSNPPGDSIFASNTQRPTYNNQPNLFIGQPQAADHSYLYNRPSITFHTPSAIRQSNNFPSGLISNQFNRVTQSMTTPLDATFATQYQGQSNTNNSPKPTSASFSPYFPTVMENDSSKNTFQASNGITQASISPFPPIVPTSSSNFKQPVNRFNFRPQQQSELSTPSESTFSQPDITSTIVTDKPNSEIYEYTKPSQGLPSGDEKEGDLSTNFGQDGQTTTTAQLNQQKPISIFGMQPSLSISQGFLGSNLNNLPNKNFNQGSLNNNKNTFSQFRPGSESDLKPSKFFPTPVSGDIFEAQKQNTQTDTTATLSQNPTFGLQSNTKFGSFDNKKTTLPNFQQFNKQTETQFNNKLSTSIPSSFETRLGNSQTQFTQSFMSQLPTKQPQFGIQINPQFGQASFGSRPTTASKYPQSVINFDSRPSMSISSGIDSQKSDEQTDFPSDFPQFVPLLDKQKNQGGASQGTTSQQTSTTTNEQSTSTSSTEPTEAPSSTTMLGEVYDYTKPTQNLLTSSQNKNINRFGQVEPQFGSEPNKEFHKPIIPMFLREKPSQFGQQTQQSNLNFKPNTPKDEKVYSFTQTQPATSTGFNTGTTLDPSTPQDQTTFNTRVTEQPSTAGEIYDYTKPAQGLSTNPQDENKNPTGQRKPQYPNDIDTPFGPMIIPIYQREKLQPLGQRPQQSNFNLQNNPQLNNRGGDKETTGSPFSQTQVLTTQEQNTGTTQDQALSTQISDKKTTVGEIYEYKKPEEGLPVESQKEITPFGQNSQEEEEEQDQGNFESNQSTTAQSTQAPVTAFGSSQTEANENSQNSNTFKQHSVSNQGFGGRKPTEAKPIFSFHSPCCQFKAQNNDGSAANRGNLNSNFGTNPFKQNPNIGQVGDDKNRGEEPASNFPSNSLGLQGFDPQMGSKTFAGIGEKFGGPRKPPSFDETGYHY